MPNPRRHPLGISSLARMLFRKEALEFQAQNWDGKSEPPVDRMHPVLTWGLISIALAALAYLATATIPRKQVVNGILEPNSGLSLVSTPIRGVVAHVNVLDGALVEQGQSLLELSTDVSVGGQINSLKVAESIEQQKLATHREILVRRRQSEERLRYLESRLTALKSQRESIGDERHIADQRVLISEAEWNRNLQLAEGGLITRAIVQQRELELLEAKARRAELKRQSQGLEQEISTISGEIATVGPQLEVELEALNRSIASLDQSKTEASGRASTVLSAPIGGRISFFRGKVGESILPNQSIAIITPKSDLDGDAVRLVATLYAPSRSVGHIKTGQEVAMKLRAFPYQRYGTVKGTVSDVSQVALDVNDLPTIFQRRANEGLMEGESFYKVSVQLDLKANERIQPRAGLTLDAELKERSMKMWEWIFDPLLKARALAKE